MRAPPDAVMLFAAGFGARMRPLTDSCPKPLIKVAGETLIDHALGFALDLNPARIVANLHYLPDQLETHLAGSPVTTLREAPEILDTGGGLRNALPALGTNPVFTINTDAIWAGPNPLRLLRDAWDPDRMDALLTVIPMVQTRGREDTGDFSLDSKGRLDRGPGWVYGGAQILKTDRLARVEAEKFSLNLIWNQMHDTGRLFGCPYPGYWCDVGHPAGIKVAEQMLAEQHV